MGLFSLIIVNCQPISIKIQQLVQASTQRHLFILRNMTEPSNKLSVLIHLFNQLFFASENTKLVCFADEPFYQAATATSSAIVFSRADFYSSALHEIAHWCIAGSERRKLDDYGYWYKPEGRSAVEQTEFEQVEVKPQAIEWALSLASNHPFHFSADNIEQGLSASESFQQSVYKQLSSYLKHQNLPPRAQLLFDRLNKYYRDGRCCQIPQFTQVVDQNSQRYTKETHKVLAYV
jgi:elongation factor P hydroxylase